MICKLIYIYGLIDPITEQLRYVGISVDPRARYKDHIKKAQNKSENTYKSNWIEGLLSKSVLPVMEILDIKPIEQLEFWEQHYISYFKAIGCRLTNIALGGYHNSVALETKNKISLSLTGRKLSDEQVAKRRGRKVSDETLAKMSIAQKGKVTSAETKAKMSAATIGKPKSLEHRQAMCGRVFSEETRLKMSLSAMGKAKSKGTTRTDQQKEAMSIARKGTFIGDKNPFYGKKHDDETRKRISEAIAGRKLSETHKEKLCKPITEVALDGSVLREYKSIKEASEHHSIPLVTISVNCRKNLVKQSVVQKTQTRFVFK